MSSEGDEANLFSNFKIVTLFVFFLYTEIESYPPVESYPRHGTSRLDCSKVTPSPSNFFAFPFAARHCDIIAIRNTFVPIVLAMTRST